MSKQPKKKMGRPPSPDGAMAQIGFRLGQAVLDDYDQIAAENHRKRADMMRRVLEDYRNEWRRTKRGT